MRKIINYFLFSLIVTLLFGCPGAIEHLSWKKLSGDYIYHEPSGLPFIEKEHGDKGIPGWIYAYDFDDDFIIAMEMYLNLSEKQKDDLETSGELYEYVKENGYSKYWIIVHVNDSIYGPYNLQEYTTKRGELGVPNNLQLK